MQHRWTRKYRIKRRERGERPRERERREREIDWERERREGERESERERERTFIVHSRRRKRCKTALQQHQNQESPQNLHSLPKNLTLLIFNHDPSHTLLPQWSTIKTNQYQNSHKKTTTFLSPYPNNITSLPNNKYLQKSSPTTSTIKTNPFNSSISPLQTQLPKNIIQIIQGPHQTFLAAFQEQTKREFFWKKHISPLM